MRVDVIEFYSEAVGLARKLNQVVGEKRNYYITLAQLEGLIQEVARRNQANLNLTKE